MSSDEPKSTRLCPTLDEAQISKASNERPGHKAEGPTTCTTQTQSLEKEAVAQSSRPAMKKPSLNLKGRPKLHPGVFGVTKTASDSQCPEADNKKRQEEQLDELRREMGVLSLSEGKVMRKGERAMDCPSLTVQRVQLKREDIDVLGSIDSGTFCEVYRIKHKPTDLNMAAKVVYLTEDVEQQKKLLMTLHMMSLHHCPHIMQYYGSAIWRSELWVFMELMATSLDKLLKEIKEPFPEEIVCKMTVSIVKALHYLKEKHNVAHRDMKPSSVLINHAGNVKLCDFGIYGQLVHCQVVPRDGGESKYIAPERLQLQTCNQDYDIRSDIWRLGISLVELATGASPYSETQFHTAFELLCRILEGPPPLPEKSRFSPEFYDFVSQCLTKDVEQRPHYTELLQHPLIDKYEHKSVDIAAWFDGVCKKHRISWSTL